MYIVVTLKAVSDDEFRSGCRTVNVIERSISPSQDYTHPEDHTSPKSSGLKIRVRHVICCFKSYKLM